MKPRRATARVAAWLTLLALPTSQAATCKYVQVKSGDSCWSLAATGCGGITLATLYKYNGGDDSFCNNLKLKEPICCSSGDKPDLTPQKGKDGSCASYTVKTGDICQSIQDEFYLKSGDLALFNKGKTWGWAGCNKLVLGMSICVSNGSPPMPGPIDNAVCGPQVYVSSPPPWVSPLISC
jgi:LysM repeat protein